MTRVHFVRSLDDLRDRILTMGSYVAEELRVAMEALATLDTDKAGQVAAVDRKVNALRYEVEERCFTLIATQQPAASDLRLVFAATSMVVDLERMGDQAKGIAKLIPGLRRYPDIPRPHELHEMGELVTAMLRDALRAYAEHDVQLAREIATRDDAIDATYARLFTQTMHDFAKASDPEHARIFYDLLRAARELERFGDLVANFVERSAYISTGEWPTQ
jgi:phosphate transport system protein